MAKVKKVQPKKRPSNLAERIALQEERAAADEAKAQKAKAKEAARADAGKVAGKSKLAMDTNPHIKPAKSAGTTTKLLGEEVVYVDAEGKACHARVVAGDSETVNLVVTCNDAQNPTKLVSNVKRGKGSSPHTWHTKD